MKSVLLIAALVLYGCTAMPAIRPVDADHRPRVEDQCRSFFPQGRWQLVHTISADLAGGRQATFSGVVVLSSAPSVVNCVLMTLEGFVLFEAIDDGRLTVKRAVGPFDNPEFAKGVMRDIRLIFIAPDGALEIAGQVGDGGLSCRYRTDGERFVDVTRWGDGTFRIRQFDPPKTVTAAALDGNGISPMLTLEVGGLHGYQLSMTLVDAFSIQ